MTSAGLLDVIAKRTTTALGCIPRPILYLLFGLSFAAGGLSAASSNTDGFSRAKLNARYFQMTLLSDTIKPVTLEDGFQLIRPAVDAPVLLLEVYKPDTASAAIRFGSYSPWTPATPRCITYDTNASAQIHLADINGDGALDLVLVNGQGESITVLWSQRTKQWEAVSDAALTVI